MDSPVWIPIGSRFSMLHTAIQLSQPSRTISYSISFQPRKHSSTSTCCTPPEKARRRASARNFSDSTMPLPLPPRANAPRSMTGKPIDLAASRASSADSQAWPLATLTSICRNLLANSLRSSVSRIVSMGVPRTRTPYLSNTPRSYSAIPQLSAVCPPKDSKMASTFSLIRTCSTDSGVTAIR